MIRIILHVDLNAFFVRCEEIKNPSLINKPVAVGGTGRKGIVSTCSYKARSYGIHSGMPMFQAQALCKELIVLPCDFKYYNLMSREFVHHLKQFTPLVEQASIDECYMDITESFKKYGNNNINEYLKSIQVGLYNKTKLYCSIGVASTKFLAKMGSDIKKPNGITIIRKKDIPSIIFPLPIKDYYGIGNKTYPKLQNIGINTIGDLYYRIKKNDPNDLLNNYLMNFKDNIILCLEGKSDDKLNLNDFDPKSIGRTTTFDYDSDNIDFIKNMILSQASIIIDEMKNKNKVCKTIQLVYKEGGQDSDFKTKTFAKSFNEFSDDKEFITKKISQFVDETYDFTLLRMAGVTLKNLKDKEKLDVQMTFDNYEKYESESKVQLLINDLNRKANKDLFFSGSKLKERKNGDK